MINLCCRLVIISCFAAIILNRTDQHNIIAPEIKAQKALYYMRKGSNTIYTASGKISRSHKLNENTAVNVVPVSAANML